jgi:hypothetical protein
VHVRYKNLMYSCIKSHHNTFITPFKMSRLTQLTSLLSLASVGFAQIPNVIPFQVTGSLDG